jgi:hypothetical protein
MTGPRGNLTAQHARTLNRARHRIPRKIALLERADLTAQKTLDRFGVQNQGLPGIRGLLTVTSPRQRKTADQLPGQKTNRAGPARTGGPPIQLIQRRTAAF